METLLGRDSEDPTQLRVEWFPGNAYSPKDTKDPQSFVGKVSTVSPQTFWDSIDFSEADKVSIIFFTLYNNLLKFDI
jgi:hypothetical protein